MAQLHLEGNNLVVRMGFVDAMLSVRSTIRIPLTSVVRIYVDPFVADEPRGFKAPGTYWPRLVTKGTFHAKGVKTFWNIWRGENPIVVELRDTKFDRLVIEQDNPEAIVEEITRAVEALS